MPRARRRPLIFLSTQTAMVDTFTCAIAILFVLILSLRTNSINPTGVPEQELVFTCRVGNDGGGPMFAAADDPETEFYADGLRDRLATLKPIDSLSRRVTVQAGSAWHACRAVAGTAIANLNEAALDRNSAGSDGARAFLFLEVSDRADEAGGAGKTGR